MCYILYVSSFLQCFQSKDVYFCVPHFSGLSLGGAMVKNLLANTSDLSHGFDPWIRKIP